MLVFQPGATPENEWISECLRKHTRASLCAKQIAAISLDDFNYGCKEAVDAACAVPEIHARVLVWNPRMLGA
jgi:hypothetical protein